MQPTVTGPRYELILVRPSLLGPHFLLASCALCLDLYRVWIYEITMTIYLALNSRIRSDIVMAISTSSPTLFYSMLADIHTMLSLLKKSVSHLILTSARKTRKSKRGSRWVFQTFYKFRQEPYPGNNVAAEECIHGRSRS